MKKTLFAILLLAPVLAFATPVSWDKTGSVLQPLPTSYSDEVKVPYVTSTTTTATSTFPRLSITSSISILGEYFTNFTDYVRSLFTAGTGILINTGVVSLDESVSPNWTGTHTFLNPPISNEMATTALQLVNKQQLDTVATGYILKESVVAATTGAISTSTEQTIDGVGVVTGDRVLVKNQTQAWRNGIYVVDAGDWTRATDYDETSEVKAGTFCNVLSGTTNGLKSFAQINIDPTINVDALTFTQLSASNVYTASNGISVSSNVFSLGGTLNQNTSINQANYSFDHNLNGLGDFNVTDAGSPVLTVDDTGKTTITNLVATWLSATTSLDYWYNASTTIRLVDLAGPYVSGILGLNKGGTGATTATGARTNILPSQTGNVDKALLTDGTDAYWGTVASGDGNATSTYGNTKQLAWVANGATYSTWTDMPIIEADLFMGSTTPNSGSVYYKRFDLTNAYRFRTVRNLSVAGFAGSYLKLQYSTDKVNWFNAGTDDNCTLVGTGSIPCNWSTLATGARTDVYLRYKGTAGNNVIDPRFYNLVTEFTLYSSTGNATATTTDSLPFLVSPTANQLWSDIPILKSGTYYIGFGSAYHYQTANLYKANKYRILATIATTTPPTTFSPTPGMRIDAQYSYDKTTWYNLNSGTVSPATGTGELNIYLNVNQVNAGSWVNVAEGAKSAVWLRFVGYGSSNGTNDVYFRNLELQIEQNLQADVTTQVFSTSSADHWISTYDKGYFWSTTSADVWGTTKGYLTNLLGGLNGIFGNSTTTNATTTSLAITGLSNTYLAVDGNGSVIATTTPTGGTSLWQQVSDYLTPLMAGLGITVTGTSTLATTTIAFTSKIGDVNGNYITIEDYPVTGGALNGSIPIFSFVTPNAWAPGTGGFANALSILQTSDIDNPVINFAAKDLGDTINIGQIEYATGTNTFVFKNANATPANVNIDGNLTLANLATPTGSLLAVDGSGLVISTTSPVSSESLYTEASSTLLRYGTTSDSLTEGLVNKFYTQVKVWGDMIASTTYPAFVNYWTKIGNDVSYSGNVGIGSSTPSSKLVIQDGTPYFTFGFKDTAYGSIPTISSLASTSAVLGDNHNILALDSRLVVLPSSLGDATISWTSSDYLKNVALSFNDTSNKFDFYGTNKFGFYNPNDNRDSDLAVLDIDALNKVVTTDKLVVRAGQELCLGADCKTVWPTGGGGGTSDSFWATSSNSLIGYPDLPSGYAIVIGSGATTSDVKFEVAGDTKLGGTVELPITDSFLSTNGSGVIVPTTTPVLTEVDPIFTSSFANTIASSTNWDTAFSWGNHALGGYLTNLLGGLNAIFGNSTTTNATTTTLYATTATIPTLNSTTATISQLNSTNINNSNIATTTQLCFETGECMSSPSVVGTNITMYHWNGSADIAGYEMFRTYPDSGGTNVDETCSADADVAGGYCEMDSYVSTTTDLAINSIPAGTWNLHYYTYVNSSTGISRIVADVYKRSSLGVETKLFTATSTELNNTAVAEVRMNTTQPVFTFGVTDRLVVKVRGWTDSGVAKTVHFLYGGVTSNYSHIQTPITQGNFNYSRKDLNETITGSWTFSNLLTSAKALFTNATTTNLAITGITNSFLSTDGTGRVIATTTPVLAEVDPLAILKSIGTTAGDLITFSGASTPVRLGSATANSYLRSVGATSQPAWSTLKLPNSGTAFRLPVFTGTDTMGELDSAGTVGQYLAGAVGAKPVWTLFSATSPTLANLFVTGSTTIGTNSTALPTDNGLFINGTKTFRIGAGDGDGGYGGFIKGSYPSSLSTMIFGTRQVGSDANILTLQNSKVGIMNTSPSTALDVTGDATVSGNITGTITTYPAFSYATSTWVGTTTIALGPAYVAETWNGVKCFTDTGTVNVSFHDGTNRMNLFNVSTTVGSVTLSTNNSFTASEKRYVDVGTPASSPKKVSCTVSKSLRSN